MLRSGLRRFLVVAGVAVVGSLALSADQAEARQRKGGGGYNPPYASIVIDVNSGKVLQATNPDAPRFPASVTKVMTLYMLFEQIERGKFRLDTPLPVSSFASRQAPSKIGFDPGESIEVEDAIKALVTKSANDVAVVIAEAIGGDQDTFAQMMTRKARSLGMSNTTFRNASGLPNPEQVTTARDLTILGRAIHDHFPKYWRYFQTRSFEFAGRSYRNHNKLLGRVDGVDGIKTGYTRASGFNLLTSARDGNRHVMAVVLGGRSGRIRDQQMASLVENHIESASGGGRTAPMIARGPGDEPVRVAAAVPTSTPTPPARVESRSETTAQQRVEARMTARSLAEPAKAEPVKLVAAAEPETSRPVPAARAVQAAPVPPARVPTQGAIAQPVSAFAPPPAQPGPQLRWTTGPQPAIQPAAQPAAKAAPAKHGAVAQLDPVTTATTSPASQAAHAAPAPQAAPAPLPKAAAHVPAAPQHAAAAARTGFIIQLGATDDESKARAILDNAKSRNRTVLADASAFTEKVQKGEATLFRARFGGFDDNKDAIAACGALKKTGFNCFVQRI